MKKVMTEKERVERTEMAQPPTHCDGRSIDPDRNLIISQDLSYSIFHKSELSFCHFVESNLSGALVSYAQLSKCMFQSCDLEKADLARAAFGECSIYSTKMDGIYAPYIVLDTVHMYRTSLKMADMEGCDVSGDVHLSTFKGSILVGSTWEGVITMTCFDDCQLSGSVLAAEYISCSFKDVNFRAVNAEQATFVNCDFTGAKNMDHIRESMSVEKHPRWR